MFILLISHVLAYQLTVNPLQAMKLAQYKIEVSPSTVPPSDSTMTVNFPSQYSLSDPLTCKDPVSNVLQTCSVTSSTQITVSGIIWASTNQVQIEWIMNPRFNATYQIAVSIVKSDTTILLNEINSITLPLTTFNSITLEFSTYVTYSQAYGDFSITLPIDIKQNAIVRMEFPDLNSGSQNVQNMLNLNAMAIVNGISMPVVQSTYYLDINGLFTSDKPIGYTFTIRIQNIQTPIQQRYYSTVNVYFIENSQHVLKGIASIWQTFTAVAPKTVQILSSNPIIQQNTKLSFTIQPKLSYPLNSIIRIRLQNGDPLTQIQSAQLIPKTGMPATASLSVNDEKLVITNAVAQSNGDPITFEINNIVNPIVQENMIFEISVFESTMILYDLVTSSVSSTTNTITQLSFSISNTTIFAQQIIGITFTLPSKQTTQTVIYLTVPPQITIEQYCQVTSPTATINPLCTFSQNTIVISNCFFMNSNPAQLTIYVKCQLPSIVSSTDSFQMYTQSDLNKISQLALGSYITTTKSQFKLVSLTPDMPMTIYQTNYQLVLSIPQVVASSVLTIQLPLQFASTKCLATMITTLSCQIISNVITIPIDKGGSLNVIIYNITTERAVMKYFQTINADIKFNGQIQSTLINNQLDYTLLNGQLLLNYTIQSSSHNFDEESIYTLQFTSPSPILSGDVLLITVPQSLKNVLRCTPQCIINQETLQIISQEQQQFNIQIAILNPFYEQPRFPFDIRIQTAQGNLIASYYDSIGIRDPLLGIAPVFDISLSSILLHDYTNVTLRYDTAIEIPAYGKGILSYNLNFLQVDMLKCREIQLRCEQLKQDEQNHLQFQTLDKISKGSYIVNFDGMRNNVQQSGMYYVIMHLQILDQYNKLLQSSSRSQQIEILCYSQCLTCEFQYDICTSCQTPLSLHQGQCISNCPERYIKINGGCQQCLTPTICNQCDPANRKKCLICSDQYILIDGNCLKAGEVEQYQQTTQQSQPQQQNSISQQNSIELYDGIPFYIIIMCIMLVITLVIKILYRKTTIILKTFFTLISCMELMVTVLRLVRFALLLSQSYFFLSITCLGSLFYLQVANATFLQNYIRTDITLSKELNKKKLLYYSILLFQWRLVLRLIQNQDDIDLLAAVAKLIKGQLITFLLPIIILMSSLITLDHIYIFIIDDLIYQIIMLLLSILHTVWLTHSIRQSQIVPAQLIEYQTPSPFKTKNDQSRPLSSSEQAYSKANRSIINSDVQ